MIYGSGIDLTLISEFQEVIDDPGSTFIPKYYTRLEIEYCRSQGSRRQARHFAARYAAKEALLKALDGSRLHQKPALHFNYLEAEVNNDEFGRPFLKYYDALNDYVREIGIRKSNLSLSHTGDYAVAQVILEI